MRSTGSRQKRERKKREPIACARCRRLKRRCNRANPCYTCKAAGQDCRLYDEAHSDQHGPLKASPAASSGTSSGVNPSTPALAGPSTLASPAQVAAGSEDQLQLIEVLQDQQFLQVLLQVWFSQLDYMYDSVSQTRLHQLWISHSLKIESHSSLLPLVSAILSLTCQLAPERLDAALVRCSSISRSSSSLLLPSFEYAKSASDALLGGFDLASDLSDQVVDHLHASLLVAAYLKTADKKVEYRTRLSRDIAFLHCIGIHTLDKNKEDNLDSAVEEALRRLWWSYFQYDRFYWLMDNGFPYLIRRSQCDISFTDHTGTKHHITGQDAMHQSSLLPTFKLGSRGHTTTCNAQERRSSRFTSMMIGIAVATEYISDRLTELDRLLSCFSRGLISAVQLEVAVNAAIADFNATFSLLENQPSPPSPAEQTSVQVRQDHVSTITLNTLRYKASTTLANLTAHVSIGVRDRLSSLTIEATAALVERALGLTADLGPTELRWAFFINYIGQSTMDLARWLLDRGTQTASTRSLVGLVVRGRMLLCLIAKDSHQRLPTRVAGEVCAHAAKLFSGIDATVERNVGDVQRTTVDAIHAQEVWQSFAHRRSADKRMGESSSFPTTTTRAQAVEGERELLEQVMFLDALEELFDVPT